jgi:hypothetical protein
VAKSKTQSDLGTFVRKMKRLTKSTTTVKMMTKLGKKAHAVIRKRTLLGFGVMKDNAERHPFPSRTSKYDQFRKFNRGAMSRLTKPGKRNLTFTGQLIKGYKVKKVSLGSVIIGFDGNRKPYDVFGLKLKRTAKGKVSKTRRFVKGNKYKVKSRTPHIEVMEGLIDLNKKYTFNNLSRVEKKQLIRFYRKMIGNL